MNKNYLIDTNILIYFFNGLIVEKDFSELLNHSFNISIISKVEFLSWRKLLSDKDLKEQAEEFISYANIYELNNTIANQAITYRQRYKIKTPDAIIAATAHVNNLSLITNDVADFSLLNLNIKTVELR